MAVIKTSKQMFNNFVMIIQIKDCYFVKLRESVVVKNGTTL